MSYSKKRTAINIIIALIIAVTAITIVLSLNDFANTWDVIQTSDPIYMIYAGILTLAYFFLYPLPICLLTRFRKQEIPFWRIYAIGASEHFFNFITPLATGGEPFQAYAMKKSGIKVRESTGILLMNFMTFMIVTNTFAIGSLFYYQRFTANISNFGWVCILGFTVNFLVLVLFFLMTFSVGIRNLMIKIMKGLCKIKWIHKIAGENVDHIDEYFIGAQEAAQELIKSPKITTTCILLKLITMAIYYAIPFFVLLSLHINLGIDDLWYVMAGTSFATTIVVWLPTPGSSGGIELAFSSIFATLMTSSAAITTTSVSGMLLWRFLTYFGVGLLSFICYTLSVRRTKNKLEETDESSAKTLSDNHETAVSNISNSVASLSATGLESDHNAIADIPAVKNKQKKDKKQI